MKTLFIVATHGNEGFSIPVLKSIEKKFPKQKFHYDWVIGNPVALKKNTRFIDVDLNRNAPGKLNSKNYEERRAHELIALAKKFDAVVDIHGAMSNCGICTIISKPSLENILLASQLNCKNNVIWNSASSQKKGPLNQHIGRPSVELECGPKQSPETAKALYDLISKFLQNNKNIIWPTKLNSWYYVDKKLNKKEFELKTIKDFSEHKSKKEKIIPFLSQNTYVDGSFYSLSKIKFDQLFIKK